MNKRINISVSWFVKGELKTIKKTISTTSVGMAWKTGISMVPVTSPNSVKIKVDRA